MQCAPTASSSESAHSSPCSSCAMRAKEGGWRQSVVGRNSNEREAERGREKSQLVARTVAASRSLNAFSIRVLQSPIIIALSPKT